MLINPPSSSNIWQRLPHPFLILAPMEGVTDIVFRQVIATAGRPDLFFTEFTNVSSYASEEGRANALTRFQISPTDSPIIAQIWGKNPEHFAATSDALYSLGFSGIDLNFGCPDRHVNHAGGGAAMIQTPALAIQCFREAKSAAGPLPVSIKTRLGWSDIAEYQTWLPTLLRKHPAALTVHLRTRKEMSKVPAHYELIDDIARMRATLSPETKLIINGDVRDRAHALALHAAHPSVDGFMIGRGVFANPYCFTDHTPTEDELMSLLHLHLALFTEYAKDYEAKNHKSPSYEPLKHYFKIYINNFPGAADLRTRLMATHSVAEAHAVIEDYFA